MIDMSSPEDKARTIFGERAAFYTTSVSHTDPQVLARVVALAAPRPNWNVLDIATGTGHTALALAPHVAAVTGVDLTDEMLQEAESLRIARGATNVTFRKADVHHLPFEDGRFQLVTCRRAAHHFSNIRQALSEMRRVLEGGGKLVVDDRSVPEDDFLDRCMNQLDTYHDASHIREYRESEWRQMVQDAGFEILSSEFYLKHRPLTSLTGGVSADSVQKINETLAGLNEEQRRAFNLVEKDGQLHLNHWFVMVSARRIPD